MEEEMISEARARAREVGGLRRERFKGVVPQQNGAQIYANQQQLGTFKSEMSAAINGDSQTNLVFQRHLSLNMIHPSHLSDFLRKQGELEISLLFHKELTPSDVGKLNRLVIPKRYAVKHFPNDELEFYDKAMSLWKFRYCYWKSSQSFEAGTASSRTRASPPMTPSLSTPITPSFGNSFLLIDHVPAKSSPIATTQSAHKGFKLFGVQIH